MAKVNTCKPQNPNKKHRKFNKAVKKLAARQKEFDEQKDTQGFKRPGALKFH